MIFGRKPAQFGQVPFPPGYMGGQGIGDGMIERQQMPQMGGYDQSAAMQGQSGFAPMNTNAAPKKPSFFGQGGIGRGIAGTIGDVLLQRGGNAPIYAPAMQQQNRLMQQQKMAEQQRMQEREDFMFEQNYKRENPIAPQPTEFERILQASGLPQEQQITLMQDYARNRANPVQGVPYTDEAGNTGLQFIRPNQKTGQPAVAPTSQPEYEALPAGAQYRAPDGSIRTKGGGAGNGTNGFQPR